MIKENFFYGDKFYRDIEEFMIQKINLERLFREVVMRYGLAFPENTEDLKWAEEGIGKSDPHKLFPRIVEMLKLGGETN